MKLNTKGKQAYKLVYTLLLARRNQNIKREQQAHEALIKWCSDNGADFNQVFDQMTDYMKRSQIAPSMNSLV